MNRGTESEEQGGGRVEWISSSSSSVGIVDGQTKSAPASSVNVARGEEPKAENLPRRILFSSLIR